MNAKHVKMIFLDQMILILVIDAGHIQPRIVTILFRILVLSIFIFNHNIYSIIVLINYIIRLLFLFVFVCFFTRVE